MPSPSSPCSESAFSLSGSEEQILWEPQNWARRLHRPCQTFLQKFLVQFNTTTWALWNGGLFGSSRLGEPSRTPSRHQKKVSIQHHHIFNACPTSDLNPKWATVSFKIHWKPTLCQGLYQSLVIQKWTGHNICPWGIHSHWVRTTYTQLTTSKPHNKHCDRGMYHGGTQKST